MINKILIGVLLILSLSASAYAVDTLGPKSGVFGTLAKQFVWTNETAATMLAPDTDNIIDIRQAEFITIQGDNTDTDTTNDANNDFNIICSATETGNFDTVTFTEAIAAMTDGQIITKSINPACNFIKVRMDVNAGTRVDGILNVGVKYRSR